MSEISKEIMLLLPGTFTIVLNTVFIPIEAPGSMTKFLGVSHLKISNDQFNIGATDSDNDSEEGLRS